MPNYLYKCEACDHEFLEFQMMSEAALKKCPQCKKNKLERLISGGSGIVFKGSGFYQTDYKNKGAETNSSSEKTNTAEGPKSNTSSESGSKSEPQSSNKTEKSKNTD